MTYDWDERLENICKRRKRQRKDTPLTHAGKRFLTNTIDQVLWAVRCFRSLLSFKAIEDTRVP